MAIRPNHALLAVLAALALLAGCRDEVARLGDASLPEPPGHEPATSMAAFDPEPVREALQGDWVVRRGDRTLFEFRIHGEHAAVVDHRFSEPRAREGELVIRSPTGFGVEQEDGTTWYYSFVRSGDQVFMGLGAAVEAEPGEPFRAKLGAWEQLVYDGETCRYVRTWAGETTEEVVECGFEERGERRIFHFDGPDPFREGRKRRQEWYVEGDYLLDRELALSTTRRRGGAAAATMGTGADAGREAPDEPEAPAAEPEAATAPEDPDASGDEPPEPERTPAPDAAPAEGP